MARPRVFVTGMGVVAPHGRDPEKVFGRVAAGESEVRVARSGSDRMESELLLAPVDDLGDEELIPAEERGLMARASRMAVVAAHGALARAGLEKDAPRLEEAGIFMGCSLGGAEGFEDGYRRYWARKTRRLRPKTVPVIMANGPAAHLSMRWGIRGPSLTYSIACSSSAAAVGEALRSLRAGTVDVALAGGAESMLGEGILAAWESLGVLATIREDRPQASCRPFDAARSGMVLGEGAAVFVLESEASVEARGAEPLAELLGYGMASDAHQVTEPHAGGQIRAMEAALADADLNPGSLGYVNAHATGTSTGDPVEAESLRAVLGQAATRVPVSATKAVHGHLVGAAGALELLLCVQAIREGRIPPTAHLTDPDAACAGLDLVPGEAREAPDLRFALSNSFAFGGSNAALVVGRV